MAFILNKHKLKILFDHNKMVKIVITLLFLIIMGFFYKNNAFSFRFVDEEYNFAIGKYLLKNEILYDDIITNHQPITHILSSVVQKYSNPNSTYLLVVRHREFIIAWSTMWSIILVWSFGLGALLSVLIYELTKSYLFGNLFLAESLVVYPLLFLVGLILCNDRKSDKLEIFFAGICIALSALLLGPIWPVISCLIALLLYRQKRDFIKSLSCMALGFLIIILLLLHYISVPGYFYYYLYTNLTYTVPNYQGSYYGGSWALTISKAFLAPLLSLFKTDITPTLSIIRILSLLLIINLVLFLFQKKFMKVFIIIILLGMSNIRFVPLGNQHYVRFHLLPWYSILIFINLAISIKHLKQGYCRILSAVLIITAIVLSLKYSEPALFAKRDIQKDYLINYSTHTDRGEIIRIMASSSDTLFVSPDAWIVYWQSNTNHLPKLFGYYPWMTGIPKLHSATLTAFTKNPPTFFYCDNCKGSELEKFLSQYTEVKKNGGSTRLYMLPQKIKTLTQPQLNQLNFYNVSFD